MQSVFKDCMETKSESRSVSKSEHLLVYSWIKHRLKWVFKKKKNNFRLKWLYGLFIEIENQ